MSLTSKSPKNASNFLLLAVMLVLLFGLSETALHVLYPDKKIPAKPKGWVVIPEQPFTEYHPRLGWVLKKNAASALEKNGWKIPVTTNSLGLRGAREYFKAKPAGKIRIYAAGDSFTFGYGVRDGETFPQWMETLDSRYEVMNMGVPGYGTDQIQLFADDFGYAYSPDIVLFVIYPEDFWRATRAFNDAGNGKPYYKLSQDGRLQLMHVPVPREKNFTVPQFPVFIEPSPADRLFGWSRWYTLGKKAAGAVMKKMGKEDPDSSEEWHLGRKILQKAVASARANGARPVLVLVPPHRWITGTDEPVRRSMAELAHREKADFIDLMPAFSAACAKDGPDHYYIPDDQHWTPEGNKLTAQTILKYFQDHPHPPA